MESSCAAGAPSAGIRTPIAHRIMVSYLYVGLLLLSATAHAVDQDIITTGSGVFEDWLHAHWASAPPRGDQGLDLRITRGLGSKGYDKLRVSVITQSPTNFTDFHFDYQERFRYRWTDNYLYSSLIEVTPGTPHRMNIGGHDLSITLPAENAGTRGIIWARRNSFCCTAAAWRLIVAQCPAIP